jgi:hypothetical protein
MVAAIDQAMEGGSGAFLKDAWRELVTTLDLGPEPETRACPSCHAIGMRAATRCGHCWVTLPHA